MTFRTLITAACLTLSAGGVNADNPPQTTTKAFQDVVPVSSVAEYDDVRWKDMSALDFSSRPDLIATLWFNAKSVWPEASKLGSPRTPSEIMERAKNPGLGVRQLHVQGVTGKDVRVAIIDQPLYQDHPEFAGKIAAYYDQCPTSDSSMHGPAVTSLLVGSSCGTAPESTLYYADAASWTGDAAYYAEALDWIVEQNSLLPAHDRIRVVSVSAAPSGPGSPFTTNNALWDAAVTRAESAGMMVLDCTSNHGFIWPCYYDAANPEAVEECTPGFPGMAFSGDTSKLYVPCSPRTSAEEYDEGVYSYQYTGRGGLSWTIPYAAGVTAMGWQVAPDLTAEEMRQCLFDSAYVNDDGFKFIDPPELVRLAGLRSHTADPDCDGLDNNAEAALGTDPLVADTDGDGLSDGVEVALGLNPLIAEAVDSVPLSALPLATAMMAAALWRLGNVRRQ
jgi:subtilisin family serine protease